MVHVLFVTAGIITGFSKSVSGLLWRHCLSSGRLAKHQQRHMPAGERGNPVGGQGRGL